MKNRITHISNDKYIKENLKKLFDIFINNGYPKHILNKLIYNSNNFDGPTDSIVESNNPLTYKRIPYIRNLTDKIIQHFKPFPNLRIAKYNPITIKSLFTQIKDSTPLLKVNNVVYRIPCLGCEGSYVGHTSQLLKQRISQHRSDCKIGKNSCALSLHHKNFGHNFDYNGAQILERESNYKNRLVLEMIHIGSEKNAINFKTDTNNLSTIYASLLSNTLDS